jgi:hypothetical protein
VTEEVIADLEAGTLHLSRRLLEALGAFSGGATGRPDPPSGATVKALRGAGLLGPTGLHPTLLPIAAAVADPVVRLRFDHLAPGPIVECPGWVSPDVAVFAIPDDDNGLDEILAVGTTFLAARVAALVGLGPRPDAARLPGSIPADPGLLEGAMSGLIGSSEDVRRHLGPAVPGAWVDALVGLRAGPRMHWRVTTNWAGSSGPQTRLIEVVESLDGTLILVARVGSAAELTAVTPTELWRLLIGLLPADDEL